MSNLNNALKGVFVSTPKKATIIYGRRVYILDRTNKPAWLGEDGRVLFDSLDQAKSTLAAHGYVLNTDTLLIYPELTKKKQERGSDRV